MLLAPHLPLLLTLRCPPVQLCAQPDGEREDATQYCTTSMGIRYIDTLVGDGKEAASGQLLTVHYKGSLLSDSSKVLALTRGGEPLTFTLGDGKSPLFDEACTGMRVGGTRRVLVPPSNTIPNWTPIGDTGRFDVELIGIDLPGAGKEGMSRRQIAQAVLALSFVPYFLPDSVRPELWRQDSVPRLLGFDPANRPIDDSQPLSPSQQREILREERSLVSDAVERELYGR